jgi:hypothetical protein
MGVRFENLSATDRAIDRVRYLSEFGSVQRKRLAGTLRRRLAPEAKRQITARFNVQPSYVVKRLRCFFDDTSVSLVALWTRTYLSNYKPQQNRVGVYVEIEKGRPLSLKHAFIRSPGGYNAGRGAKQGTVFCRVGVLDACLAGGDGWVEAIDVNTPAGRHVDHHGYPIAVLLGPNTAQMMAASGVEDAIAEFARDTFSAEIDRILSYGR